MDLTLTVMPCSIEGRNGYCGEIWDGRTGETVLLDGRDIQYSHFSESREDVEDETRRMLANLRRIQDQGQGYGS
jgi:hypothetical protein